MLWAIAVALIIGWMLGMTTGYESGWAIHGLYAIAVLLLVVSISREVNIYRGLKHIVHSRNFRRADSESAGY